MHGLSRLIIGLIIVWATVAVIETVGVPILPRGTGATLVQSPGSPPPR
jgi:hypothetical protein